VTTASFETRHLPAEVDVVAPDGSEIRLLCGTKRGSTAHGTLSPGKTSQAIQHRTVEEIWYVVSGAAELWRRNGIQESVEHIAAGDSLTIPRGVAFQFRTVGQEPFRFIMCTMPPWPGEQEAIPVAGPWEATRDR
jgi:mannose-6-phosphate isomerase-like protein (cupin superfamily)